MKIPNVSNIKGAEKGTFDYAHLRVPLPKDLSGSEIFALKNTASYPESYFLMRRSSDGYISATGMFKAAFPWALTKEEEAERAHHKKFHSAGEEEVAGSVWLAPEEDEYGMRHWIDALLDPTPIEKGNKDKHTTHIQMPPKFDPSAVPSASFDAPKLRASTRARSTRSASPSKMATPSRKIATPRKPRAKKTSEVVQTEEMEIVETATGAAAGDLQNVIENGTLVATGPANGEAKEQETVRIEVQETVEQDGDIETKTTNVKVDVPADHPELREPEDPAELIKQARAMVQEANKLDGVDATKGAVSKRKAEELGEDEAAERPQRPAKLARTQSTLEQKLAKEKVTRRALVGVAVMTAITYALTTTV
ncbi:uncharacterized protein N0V89_007827 [Didymosphaeria variabile]|uniref:HTH APSES-type domain-containing protein n=1 Tax=Didymosphaeria variabile TaxID=1932322 RepID=A0A9W9C9V0_9PLEO|nr:uncharacterized protein N0V89_007827 [Didymosphaeria variabile]KAJ4352479.1 hypothetical protein N0V89_007827 [Didymosphaeria variabile]